MPEQPISTNISNVVSEFVFSDLFTEFNSPNVDLFIFDNASLTLNNGSTSTSTFTGDLRMDGVLQPFRRLLGSAEHLPVTTILQTTGGLTEKISPSNLTLSGIVPFHVPLFAGVTMLNVTLQVVMKKEEDGWTFVPTLIGVLDVDGITDVNESQIALQVSLENSTLVLSAVGKNIQSAFGLSQLTLDQINIEGNLGDEQQLSISNTKLAVGVTTFNFEGIITPSAVGMVASVENLDLDLLTGLFHEISPHTLALPDFGVTFEESSIAFASVDCTVDGKNLLKGFSLATRLTAHEHTVSAQADITPSGIAFSGKIGNIDVGPVNIKEAELDFQIYKQRANKPCLFCIRGEADIQNVTVETGVYFEKQVSSWVTVLYASVKADSLSLATFFPEAENSVLDQLSLSSMSFVFASQDCSPQRLPTISSVQKGLQLISIVEEIPGLSDLTGEDHIGLDLRAHIGSTIDISVALPNTSLELGDSVTTSPFKIAIAIIPVPSIALIFGFDVEIHNQPRPLHFDMMLDVSPIEASGSATMKEYWSNPFGINGLKIGPEVAAELGINYVQFSSTGTPSTFGLAGGIAIGETTMNMAMKISTNPTEQILSGSLQHLDMKELVLFASDTVQLNIPEEDVPDFLDIRNLQFYIAPLGGSIGTIKYEPGISFACDMEFMSKEFEFYTRISDNGIEGTGNLDKIDIGPLKVSGQRGDDIALALALTPTDQKFSLDGAIDFLGAKNGAYIDVSTQGIEFNFEQNFFNHLTFQIDGKSLGSITRPASLDFHLSADMQNDITSFLKNDVSTKINMALDQAEDDIDAAKKKVTDAQNVYDAEFDKASDELKRAQENADALLEQLQHEVNQAKSDYKRNINYAERQVASAKATYNRAFRHAKTEVTRAEQDYNTGIRRAKEELRKAERDYNTGIRSAKAELKRAESVYRNSFDPAQNAVNKAQRDVDSIFNEINSTKRRINSLNSFWDAAEIAVLGIKLGGLYTAYGTATAALATANAALEAIKQGTAFVAFESARAALTTAQTGAKYTVFESAKAALTVAKTGAKYTAFESAKAVLTAVQQGTEYTAWQTAESSLRLAKVTGRDAINSANYALQTVGNTSTYIALKVAEQGLKAVQTGTSFVAFNAAKASLEVAKAGSQAVLGLADYIATHNGDIFDVRRMHIAGDLKALERGELFEATLVGSVLGNDYHWKIDLDIQDVGSFLDKLFNTAFDEAKAIAGF